MCAILVRAGVLAKADLKSPATAAGMSYSTLKSALTTQRLSPTIEDALARVGGFDREDPRWIDEAVDEPIRRAARPGQYESRDTVERFRSMLNAI